jgi:MFS family permease
LIFKSFTNLFFFQSDAWRWEFLITAIFPLLLILSFLFIPESAGYEQKKKKVQIKSNINSDYEIDNNSSKGCWSQFLDNLMQLFVAAASSKRAFIIGVTIGAFMQATGINVIMLYSPTLMGMRKMCFYFSFLFFLIEGAGLTGDRKLIGTIIVGVWNFLTTLFAVSLVCVCFIQLYFNYIFIK